MDGKSLQKLKLFKLQLNYMHARPVNLIDASTRLPKNVSILQIAKFGDWVRRYFFIAKGFEEKLTLPSNYPYRKDLWKNVKFKFARLAEFSTGNKYDKQMTSTKQASWAA